MKEMLAIMALLAFANGELVLTVSPEQLQPGSTPTFHLHCVLQEYEEASIVSMVIFRRTLARGFGQNPPERLVSMSSMAPFRPVLAPGHENLNVLGQITSYESELGSYLKLVWPSPTVEDLGIYTCETIVIEEMIRPSTLVAQVAVTTSDVNMDRLLLAVSRLEGDLSGFNDTLQRVQQQLKNVTAVHEIQQQEREQNEEGNGDSGHSEDNRKSAQNGADNGDNGSPASTDMEEPNGKEESSSIDLLASLINDLDSKLDNFNSSISAMEKKLEQLVQDDEAKNETDNVTDEPNYVRNFFSHGNSIFFLITGNRNFDTHSAKKLCESHNLSLAEVEDEQELIAISENSGPYVLRDQLVLIGGRPGTVLGSSPPHGDENAATTCWALIKSENALMDIKGVACTESRRNVFLLCEDELETPPLVLS